MTETRPSGATSCTSAVPFSLGPTAADHENVVADADPGGVVDRLHQSARRLVRAGRQVDPHDRVRGEFGGVEPAQDSQVTPVGDEHFIRDRRRELPHATATFSSPAWSAVLIADGPDVVEVPGWPPSRELSPPHAVAPSATAVSTTSDSERREITVGAGYRRRAGHLMHRTRACWSLCRFSSMTLT